MAQATIRMDLPAATIQGSGNGRITVEPHRWASRIELAPQAGFGRRLRALLPPM